MKRLVDDLKDENEIEYYFEENEDLIGMYGDGPRHSHGFESFGFILKVG